MPEKPDNQQYEHGFRLRGMEMTRLETFMDAAFAFATTMLVIAGGEIPGNYPELISALKEIPAFLLSFLIIMLFWTGHRNWSRRYGLEDSKTVLISIGLIFVLLVYVYPLRLMFSALFNWISGGWLPSRFLLQTQQELVGLFIIYGLGLFAMTGMMGFLYARAKAVRSALNLTEPEIIMTNSEITGWTIAAATGLASTLFAWLAPSGINVLAGFFYFILPIAIPLIEFRYNRKIKSVSNQDPQQSKSV
ncbi:MAG: TMEM175 family protein [candidate division KSB1 bacterium]|nr:TMEM175 family protein [candidate division KSB1 bacterium]